MSNQRSEQPGYPKYLGSGIYAHSAEEEMRLMSNALPSEQPVSVHSSAEQGTEPSDEQKRMQVVSVWLSEYLSADWFYEPWEKVERAAASAAERYNEIKSEAADLRRQLADLQKDYENNMVIKDCKQCHGQVDIIDSESGGFPAKCHCYQVRCNELRARAEAAEKSLAERDTVIGKVREIMLAHTCGCYAVGDPDWHSDKCVKNKVLELLSASPSTILESIREEDAQ